MTAKEYQAELLPHLKELFPNQVVESEWRAFTRLPHQYSPRVDIAVGPFSTTPGQNLIRQYDDLISSPAINQFLRQAFDFHILNLDATLYDEVIYPNFDEATLKNQNARCLMAIEIENKNSKKHMMGSILNACSLGRVGIGVAFNLSTLRTFCRIVNYLSFLKRVEKNSYDVTNFLIITTDQLHSIELRP